MAKIKLTKSAVDTAEVTQGLRTGTLSPAFSAKHRPRPARSSCSSTARTGASKAEDRPVRRTDRRAGAVDHLGLVGRRAPGG